MNFKNLSQRLFILSAVTILTGCAVYAHPTSNVDGVYSSSIITTPIPNNGVTYSTEIYPYSNGIIYTPPPIYFNYYPSRPYYRPHPYYSPSRPPRPHAGHPGVVRPDKPFPPKGSHGHGNWGNKK